jgi:hypothetical protein
LPLGLLNIGSGQLDQPRDILRPFFSHEYNAEIDRGLAGRLLNGNLLVENKFGLFLGLDFLRNGVTRMLELHLTRKLDFHLDW